MPLSPREQEILAAIEDELGGDDPALVRSFSRTQLRPSSPEWLPLSGRRICVLVVALLTLVALQSLVWNLDVIELAILTAVLIVPWIVAAAREDAESARTMPPAGPDDQDAVGQVDTEREPPAPISDSIVQRERDLLMVRVIGVLLLAWVALSLVGAVIEGLLWLMVVGVALLLGTATYAAIKRRTSREIP